MTRAQRLAESIHHSMNGPMWHGPCLADVLEEITPAQAAARPIPSAHTIWELVLHMAYWLGIIRQRLASQTPVEGDPELDWQTVSEPSAEAWRAALQQLKTAHMELAADVGELSDSALDARVPGRDHSVEVMIHGIVEHDVYHGGQVAILKKALT